MVGRSCCTQREGKENIFSMMQNSGRWCCTQTEAAGLGFLCLSTGKESSWEGQPRHLKIPFSNTKKPRLRLFLLGTKSSNKYPKHSHPVHTEKLWSGISAETCAHQQSISPHCVRGHVLQKSHILWSKRQDETRDSGYWGFWLAGNTTFFSLFFGHEHSVDK